MGLPSYHQQQRIIGLLLLSLLTSYDSSCARTLEHGFHISTVNMTEKYPQETVLGQVKPSTDLALDAPHPEPMGSHSNVDHVAYYTAYLSVRDKYDGVHALLEVFNVDGISETQASAAFVWVSDGTKNDRDVIAAGWMVSYPLYGDYQPRLTVYFNVRGKGGCYNTMCPGFTQTHPTIKLGMALHGSAPWETADKIIIEVRLDAQTQNWVLIFGSNDHLADIVGYWEHGFFGSMVDSCAQFSLGGYVDTSPDERSPKMGNGHSPSEKSAQAAGILGIMYLNSTYGYLNPQGVLGLTDRSSAPTYDVGDLSCGDSGCSFYYGGNGGLTGA